MTDYRIDLNESLSMSDSISTSIDFHVILNEVINFITSLGGLIS